MVPESRLHQTVPFPAEIFLSYIPPVARANHVTKHVRSQIEWKGAQWVEAQSRWHVYIRDLKTGEEFIHEAKVLISAVRGYSNPKFPVLPGLEQFAGPVVHPAQWNKEYDLRGVMDAPAHS